MTAHKIHRSFTKSAFRHLMMSTLLLCATASGAAARTVVIDHEAQKNTAKAATEAQIQTDESKKQSATLDTMSATLGEPGAFQGILNSEAWKKIGSNSEFYNNMQAYGFDMCAINLCLVGHNPSKTKDVQEAREWAMTTFFASKPISNDEADDINEVRRRAVAYTATNGLAVAATIHNELIEAQSMTHALESFVSSANGQREDLKALAAVAIADYKISLQQLAVLTSLLDIQASFSIKEANIYHEDGGKEFPDAYIASDLRHDKTRQLVTAPKKGAPSEPRTK